MAQKEDPDPLCQYYLEQEESYTSQASFLDEDKLPLYGQKETAFSGKRNRRFYTSKNGTILNADINGAANILRKAFPNAFLVNTDRRYLTKNVQVWQFKDFHQTKQVSRYNG